MKRHEIVTPKHAQGIGEVMVSWAILEVQVLKAFRALLGTTESKTMLLFWHMSFKERLDRLGALVGLHDEDQNSKFRKEFDTLVTRMQFMEGIRNTTAHSLWSKGDKPNAITPFVLKARGVKIQVSGVGLPREQFTPERLFTESEKIARLAKDVKDFFATHFEIAAKDAKEEAH